MSRLLQVFDDEVYAAAVATPLPDESDNFTSAADESTVDDVGESVGSDISLVCGKMEEEDASTSSSRNNHGAVTALHFLLIELRLEIYKLAMTGRRGILQFTDQVDDYKPGIATSLLLVNRATYHDVRNYLYSENLFVFHRSGSDFRILAQPRDFSSHGALTNFMAPTFKNVVFDFGDDGRMEFSHFCLETFGATLKNLRTEIKIRNLTIHLRDFFWVVGFHKVEAGLRNIRVTGSLTITGKGYHWNGPLRAIPLALRMKPRPVSWALTPGRINAVNEFFSKYVPAATVEETQLRAGEVLEDPGTKWARLWAS